MYTLGEGVGVGGGGYGKGGVVYTDLSIRFTPKILLSGWPKNSLRFILGNLPELESSKITKKAHQGNLAIPSLNKSFAWTVHLVPHM